MLAPGDTVRGYTVTALLGEGGMGAVCAAVRESDGLEVAVDDEPWDVRLTANLVRAVLEEYGRRLQAAR